MPRPASSVITPGYYDALKAAGYFPHEVTIKRAVTSRTSTGATLPGTPQLYYNAIPARVIPLGFVGLRRASGVGEVRRADGAIAENPVDVELAGRYNDIADTDVATFDNKTWNILNVIQAPADGRTILQMEVVK